jgi:antibiotic biosynthesis monooxygenase (ABM) superfamily enzyme
VSIGDLEMNTPITLVVALFIHPGRSAEFESFETQATEIMSRVGGRIERRIGCSNKDDASAPDEVHLVTFPDADSYNRYRASSELQALASLRAVAIRKTVVWRGFELPAFDKSTTS